MATERHAAERVTFGQIAPGQLPSNVNASARARAGGVRLHGHDSSWEECLLGDHPKVAVRLCF
jgi:hypothetical protein